MLSFIFSLFGCKPKNEKSGLDKQIAKSVAAFENRMIYEKLTKEIIDSASDDDLLQIVYDNICSRFNSGYSDDFEIVSSLSPGQQAVYATWWVEAEVNNGGFNQFYFNSSGRFAGMAEKGFRLMGAERFADLMAEANKVYSENKERLEAFDDGTLESFSESYNDNPLNELDEKFYTLEEDLNGLRIKYIRTHYQEFIR